MLSKVHRVLDISAITLAIVCGVGSLVLLMPFPLGSLTVLRWSWSEPWLLCLNALLSCVFFVQHSGMNRRRFRDWLAIRLAPRYHGALYSVASGAVLTLVVAFWQPTATQLVVLHGVANWFVRAFGALALGLFVWSALSLLTFDPLGLRPIHAHLKGAPSPELRFVVRGPYRWVRHPLYSCAIVMIWCWPEVTADRLLFNLLWTIWICVGAHLEEGDLTSDFGDAYRSYCAHVPMLIPWRGRARTILPTSMATGIGQNYLHSGSAIQDLSGDTSAIGSDPKLAVPATGAGTSKAFESAGASLSVAATCRGPEVSS